MIDTNRCHVVDLDVAEMAAVDGGAIPIVVALGMWGAIFAFGYMMGKDSVN